ncbi:hypothetical protein [Burkholderia sp. 3C]
MRFVLHGKVPILSGKSPISAKIAAMILLVFYFPLPILFVQMLCGYHDFESLNNFQSSEKMSAAALGAIVFFLLTIVLVWVVVKGFLLVELFSRQRWAKNVLSVILVIKMLAIFLAYVVHPEDASLAPSNNIDCIAEVVAVILLATPKSIAWFRFKKSNNVELN